ncbi:Conserved_hypothetical protein [Hexamita inflata]|uniref:Uncharacterized protein n=1 Tax=Hexamita inflata TaxID=28002 RepID=A0AA86R4U9_9EUKA|nr:Conserved hypothetical protein [Hexamita inflata]
MPKGSSTSHSGSSGSKSTASTKSTPSVRVNANGTFDQRSSAFKSGEAYLKSDGTLDGRCTAARQGILGTTSSGQADLRYAAVKNAPWSVDRQDVEAQTFRNTYQQTKYRESHESKYSNQNDVDHIVSLQIVAQQTRSSKSSLSEDTIATIKKAYNTSANFRMRDSVVNRTENNRIDEKIMQALQGDDVQLNRAEMQRLSQQVKASQEVAQNFPDVYIVQSIASDLSNLYNQQSNENVE